MDKYTAIKLLEQYVKSIPKDRYKLKKAYLFGSYAKNNFHKDSDIDVALIMDDVKDLFDTQVEMMILRRKIDLSIEPHIIRNNEFDKYNPFYNEIQNHGFEIKIN